MSDYTELKRLAEAAKEACGDYIPLSDGGMSVHQMIGRIKACESTEPLCEEERTVLLAISRTERNQLKVENEALRKDAERYRWLRDSSESIHQFYLSTPIWFTGVKFSKENVDSTIDAAMGNGEQS